MYFFVFCCSVTLTVNATNSSSGHCHRQGKFGCVFTPIPKSDKTPVNVEELKHELAGYSDATMKDYLLNGFTYGFDIGYRGPRSPYAVSNPAFSKCKP